ncbi:MAG: tRNA preQ1(34) S-adenosylmethionine ribosyltransferase-isomerase QueA [Rhodospirillaceae bacterium]|nr:MAG: tRNA preQ1(34) S-adenosylmethionine ribosyltransferase-isomerase QueA [Rhodospirillaceae bacterium]
MDHYDFDLPRERIAERPISPRDHARLLVVGEPKRDCTMMDLPDLLEPGDLLVFNDTRVIPTRLFGQRKTGKVEVTLHKALAPDRWLAFAKPARKLKAGDRLDFAEGLSATIIEKREGGEICLQLSHGDAELMAILERIGRLPLPPYLRRTQGPDAQDREDYQTIFAKIPGAVAAPTAGLHYTERLLAALAARGVRKTTLTLHVGAGTFLPVTTDNLAEHQIHSEWGTLSQATIDAIAETRARGGCIIPVGTTSLRLLESAAAPDGSLRPYTGETSLFIKPGYKFRVADLLLTNFHLPRSTLFVLVCAFAGRTRMGEAYAHAIAEKYRFFSYGDCSLLMPETK